MRGFSAILFFVFARQKQRYSLEEDTCMFEMTISISRYLGMSSRRWLLVCIGESNTVEQVLMRRLLFILNIISSYLNKGKVVWRSHRCVTVLIFP